MTLEKELEKELSKRDRIRERQMARYAAGSATRRRTTTSNAEADRCNDRIEWLRSEIKKREQTMTTSPHYTDHLIAALRCLDDNNLRILAREISARVSSSKTQWRCTLCGIDFEEDDAETMNVSPECEEVMICCPMCWSNFLDNPGVLIAPNSLPFK
jgi:hypothetical protein